MRKVLWGEAVENALDGFTLPQFQPPISGNDDSGIIFME